MEKIEQQILDMLFKQQIISQSMTDLLLPNDVQFSDRDLTPEQIWRAARKRLQINIQKLLDR